MNFITINGVRGYIDENGTAQLNLEDVSRGLGFTQNKNGVEYVRWETVFDYLKALGFSQQVGKDDFIPENIFYRLAMKAKNEAAELFQAKVADEILPTIRKTGSYSVQQFQLPQSMPEALRLLATEMEDKQRIAAEKQVLELQTAEQNRQLTEQAPKVAFANMVVAAGNTQPMGTVAKAVGMGRNSLFKFLRDKGVIMRTSTLPYQQYIDRGYFIVREVPVKRGDDLIVNEPAARVTARGLEYIAKLVRENQGA